MSNLRMKNFVKFYRNLKYSNVKKINSKTITITDHATINRKYGYGQ